MSLPKNSEYVLNADNSVYHLALKNEHIADTVIVVGDPGRVREFSKYFENIEFQIENREFVTHTGYYNKHRLTVLSTGIGTDNIDIVMNELDAAVNIDPITKQMRAEQRKLNIVRVGTSGTLRPEAPVDSFLISANSLSLDNVLQFYANTKEKRMSDLEDAFNAHMQWPQDMNSSYAFKGSEALIEILSSDKTTHGTTLTASGFYAPQGRVLRLPLRNEDYIRNLQSFEHNGRYITNFEMETSALYGLSALLGHECCTICAIIANRATGDFSADHHKVIDDLIKYTLNKLTSN